MPLRFDQQLFPSLENVTANNTILQKKNSSFNRNLLNKHLQQNALKYYRPFKFHV